MKELSEIQINQFQLAVLLDEEERHFYNVVVEGFIYCSHCRGFAGEGVELESIC
jgi:hypothetical protein